MGRNLERLFARYVDHGDLRALTRVFDRTARDLLALAQHLVRDPDDAEDLVQSTFVTAIDRASSWDRERALLPWLSGILARQASNLIRTRSRRAAEQLAEVEDGARGPARAAEAAELQGALGLALGRVGEKYREVLEPYLQGGERPEAIARSLGRAPGTVRTQIHRGLTMLRRFLPAGVSAGFLVGSVRGLPAVRAAVLRHASASVAVAPVASVGVMSAGLVLGGTIMVKKMLVIGVGTLAASIGVLAWSSKPLEPIGLPAAETLAEEPELAPLPVELVATALEPAAAPAELVPNAPATAPDRKAVRHGRALIRGQLLGALPEHAGDVKLVVRKASRLLEIDASLTNAAALSLGYGQLIREDFILERLDYSLQLRTFLDADGVVTESRTETSNLIELDGVEITADGRFEIDLTGAVLGAFAADGAGQASYSVTASHEVYFDATGSVIFSANAHAQVLAGEEIALSQDLELQPAAVIRGIARVGEEEPEAPASMLGRVMVLSPPNFEALTESLVSEYRASAITFHAELVMITQTDGGGQFVIRYMDSSPGIELALFRADSGEPLATTRADQDGSFEFRVAEDGPFLVVAVDGDRPPASRPVELALKSVLELEEELELEAGPLLEGLVEDFGAFPGGGIALEAKRLATRGDVPIEWSRHDLAWSRGAVVRTVATTQTESGGLFTISGLSPGAHEVRLAATGSATLFSEAELDAAAEEVAVPASGLQLVLPLAVLELHAERPPFTDDDVALRFVVEDPETGAQLANAGLDGDGRGEVVARPGQELRIRIEGEGLTFPDWEGTAPDAGERIEVRVPGREAPDTGAGEAGD